MTEIAFRSVAARRVSQSGLEDWWRSIDRWSLGALLALIAAGLVLGMAASPPLAAKNGLWPYHYVARQAVFAGIGLSIVVGLSMAGVATVRRLGIVLFAVFLLATAVLPLWGTDFGKGAVRWYSLGLISVQPAEFLKPGYVLVCALLMAGSAQPGGPPGRTIAFVMTIPIVVMLAMQPDFGQTALLAACFGALLFVSGAPVGVLIFIASLLGGAAVYAYANSEHFAGRIDKYLLQEIDPYTQLAYAEAAIREGGLLGVGAGQGSVKWTLPDAHTDLIIAVAAEEFGLLITLMVVGLYLLITLRSMARLSEIRDPFVRLGGVGLAMLLGLQAFVNVSVAVRLLPTKGMTLPFVSYGGSSLIAAAIGVGALLALTRTRPQDPGHLMRGRV